MAAWTNDELTRIGDAEELGIAPERRDGSWFRAAETRREGRISAGGVEKDVTFVDADDVNIAIDAAYRAKYRRYSAGIVNTTLTPQARAATLQLVPRNS